VRFSGFYWTDRARSGILGNAAYDSRHIQVFGRANKIPAFEQPSNRVIRQLAINRRSV